MRGLIVGLGSIGRRHARNWAALGLGPLAICRQANAAQPEPLGVSAKAFTSLDQALESWRPDVVLVTNPTSAHVETACRAIKAGSHVFVEKPLGHTLAGVDALLEQAAASDRCVMVGYNLRFHPGLVRLRELVQQRAIGRIVSARAEVGEYLPDWHPWEDYRASYAGRRELGGGAVLTFSHEIDSLCWLLGAPRRVSGMTAHASSLEIDTEDVAEITLNFEVGSIGSVHMDYVRRPPHRSIELIGENGVMRWDYAANRIQVQAATRWVEEGDPRWERNHMYVDELRAVASAIEGHQQRNQLTTGEQGAAVLSVALAALRSATDGNAIDLCNTDAVTRAWLSSLNCP